MVLASSVGETPSDCRQDAGATFIPQLLASDLKTFFSVLLALKSDQFNLARHDLSGSAGIVLASSEGEAPSGLPAGCRRYVYCAAAGIWLPT